MGLGDIYVNLFDKDISKTSENFCVHANNYYFNDNIFHRVMKRFMIQMEDFSDTDVGGAYIQGGEFEDEFKPNLKYNRLYTLSMVNVGLNANDS